MTRLKDGLVKWTMEGVSIATFCPNLFTFQGKLTTFDFLSLKEYYEIVGEARPLSGFFLHTCLFCYTNAFIINVIMKLSKFPVFRVIRALIASQSHNRRLKKEGKNLLNSTVYFLLSYCCFGSHFTQVL